MHVHAILSDKEKETPPLVVLTFIHLQKKQHFSRHHSSICVHKSNVLADTCDQTYRLVAPVDPHQEQRLCDEEADAQVLVDGVAVALEAAEEAEGEEADEEADQ